MNSPRITPNFSEQFPGDSMGKFLILITVSERSFLLYRPQVRACDVMWRNIRGKLNTVTCYCVKGQVWNVTINRRKTGLMVKLRLVKKHFPFGCRGEREKARLATTCEIWPFTATPAINLQSWEQAERLRSGKIKGLTFSAVTSDIT